MPPRLALRAVLLVIAIVIGMGYVNGVPQVQALPKTIIVPNEYPTIQSAIDSATNGDTVFVRSGTYTERITINKSISLIGEASSSTTINVPPSAAIVGVTQSSSVIRISGDDVRIANLTVSSNNAYGIGIETGGNGTVIAGNNIFAETAVSTRGFSTTVIENNITGYACGVSCRWQGANITNNNILQSRTYGVSLAVSSWNAVIGNTVTGYPEGYGIFIMKGEGNIIANNTVVGKSNGITVDRSGKNNIIANTVTQCTDIGLDVDQSYNNTFTGNFVKNNGYGAGLSQFCRDNTFYGNIFMNNVLQVKIDTISDPTNFWDNGRVGNYWSNYLSRYLNAVEIDSSGIGNTPYAIDANNVDRFPLMKPVAIPEVPTWIVVPLILTISLLAVLVTRKRNLISSKLSHAVSNG